MKKTSDILIFFSFRRHKTGYNELLFERLQAASKQYPIALHKGSLSDAHLTIHNGQMTITESLTGRDIKSFGLIYFEFWTKAQEIALATALYARRHGVKFASHEPLHISAQTKTGELALLADNNLPLPDTFLSSSKQIKARFTGGSSFGYPLVVKAADGFGGNHNFLVHDYEALVEVLDAHADIRFVVQKYIPNDCDYRCLVLGNEVRLVLKRTRSADAGTHLNNTSKGGEGVIVPVEGLSEAVRADVVKAAQLVHRGEFAGVDLMFDSQTGQHYILEVNQAPQIENGAMTEQKMDALLTYMTELVQEGQDNE